MDSIKYLYNDRMFLARSFCLLTNPTTSGFTLNPGYPIYKAIRDPHYVDLYEEYRGYWFARKGVRGKRTKSGIHDVLWHQLFLTVRSMLDHSAI